MAFWRLQAFCKRRGFRFQWLVNKPYYKSRAVISTKTVKVGWKGSLSYRLIAFAHELGHLIDIERDRPKHSWTYDREGKLFRLGCYTRESRAWDIGEGLLRKETDVFHLIKPEFVSARKYSLGTYSTSERNAIWYARKTGDRTSLVS